MSEHGWPHDEHHDDGQHHEEFVEQPVDDLGAPEEPLSGDWDTPEDDHLPAWEDGHHDEPAPVAAEADDTAPAEWHDDAAGHDEPPVSDEPADLFPPPVDVGPLPEPVDGFPWIDTGSLGMAHAGIVEALDRDPEPAELAEYAAEELPPAVDPWAALAESEDPATAALAKFYRPDQI